MTSSSDLPPAPLTLEGNPAGFVYVTDADGRKVMNLLGPEGRKIALAAWVVETYNREAMETRDG